MAYKTKEELAKKYDLRNPERPKKGHRRKEKKTGNSLQKRKYFNSTYEEGK